MATPRGRTMHPERLSMEISLVQNYIYDNFYFDHKAAQSNLTELFFLNLSKKTGGGHLEILTFSVIRFWWTLDMLSSTPDTIINH